MKVKCPRCGVGLNYDRCYNCRLTLAQAEDWRRNNPGPRPPKPGGSLPVPKASEYLKAIYDHCADLESLENILRRDSKEAIAVAISGYRWKLFNRAMGIQKETKG